MPIIQDIYRWLSKLLFCIMSLKIILLKLLPYLPGVNELISWHRSWSTLAQVMACCLTAPSHYLNQCLLIVSTGQWCLFKGNFTRDSSAINHENQLQFASINFFQISPGVIELTALRTAANSPVCTGKSSHEKQTPSHPLHHTLGENAWRVWISPLERPSS